MKPLSNLPSDLRLARHTAFTLVELLVVMAIIGVLAAIGIPAMKGMGGSNDIAAGVRQLMDDLSYARLKAINERSTVYVVFVSPTILNETWTPEQRREVSKLAKLQYTSYALFTKRSLGDQPGPGTPRYITEWKTLPDGIIIPTNKFNMLSALTARRDEPLISRPFFFGDNSSPANKAHLIPFPNATNAPIPLPYIAFDFQGRLKQPPNMSLPHDVIIPISKGSVVYPQEDPALVAQGNLAAAEVIETPKGNYTNNPCIRIDWLTGRARVVRPEKMDYADRGPTI
jgi:prepilin-type N-terminal cleavage/methylation domain-containing protein